MLRPCLIGACLVLAGAANAESLTPPGRPPAIAPHPVTETLWGRAITDDYRFMEALDPATITWMKAEGAYTRTVLDAIKPLPALRQRIAAFTASFGFIQNYAAFGGRAFYELRAPGSDNFDLMVKDAKGTRKIVDVAALRAQHGGEPFAINYFLASPDGMKVAVGISSGGSEDAAISVLDAATGATVAGPMDRAEFGATAWSDDGRTLFFIRLKKLAAGESPIHKYFDATLDAWDLKAAPLPILGSAVGHGPHFEQTETPAIQLTPTSPRALAANINGVQNEIALWQAPATQAADPAVTWIPFVTRDDGITKADAHGDDIFLLSHKGAPTFQVLGVKAGQVLATAKVLVPAKPDRVLDSIHAASDALYVLAAGVPIRSCCVSPMAAARSRRSRCPSRATSKTPSPTRAARALPSR